MHRSLLLQVALLAALLPFSLAAPPSLENPLPEHTPIELEVNEAPQSPRPYIIRHFASAQAVQVGNDLFRFPVTGNASGGVFSLVRTNTPTSPVLNIFPHYHKIHYETFFANKGRAQLWQQHQGEQQARILSTGDFAALPPGTNHTFQTLDPDTELFTCIVPGGLEAVFFAIGKPISTTTNTPYPPLGKPYLPPVGNVSDLFVFDVYAELSFVPRRDLVDGSAPPNSVWHNGPNAPASNAEDPYYIANGFGPKYLTTPTSYTPTPFYQIVQPLVPVATSGKNFSISTISLAHTPPDQHSSEITAVGGHCAFEVLEGALTITIASYPPTVLYTGDVAFIPKGVKYSYASVSSFTKVYYVSAGNAGIDQILISKGKPWNDVVFPLN